MANVDRSRKLLIRTALVTSSTIATLVGAQNLAMLDARPVASNLVSTPEPTQPLIETIAFTPVPTTAAAPTQIVHAAPSLIILRRAGQTGPIQPPVIQPAAVAIQPPAPVQLAAPAPVIVQGEAPPPIIIQQSSGSSSGGGSSSHSRSSSSR